jgi:uncharacterized protein
MSQAQSLQTEELPDDEVADYLRRHPDFFGQHRELLAELAVPHNMGAASSLLERQVAVLREINAELQRKFDELVDVARENDRLADGVHRLGMALLRSRDLGELLHAIRTSLYESFGSEAPVLRVGATLVPPGQSAPTWVVDPADPGLALFDDLIAAGEPRCGRLPANQAKYLFGTTSDHFASAALIPLAGAGWAGLLAIGGRDPLHFRPELGTFFLCQIGGLISSALARYLAAVDG